MEINRFLSLSKLDFKESYFLFGCRQVGKTWLLKKCVNADIYIDFLDNKEFSRYLTNPDVLLSEIKALNKENAIIIIDEIQKIPGLLDEVHRAIESSFKPKFILTGSSARKLKRSHANMLGGRAITLKLLPLTYYEVRDQFVLKDFLQFGGLPKVFCCETKQQKKALLESYVSTYLKEEIYDESKIRNLPAFTKFLDLAGFENGKIINYANIAREVGVSSSVVKDYFSILEDSLLGFYLMPYYKSCRKRIVNHPKFYFIDTGLTFAIKRMLSIELLESTPLWGEVFEHFVILEVIKAISYLKLEINTWFFRVSDKIEVDLILEKHGKIIPVEIKANSKPNKVSGLKSFMKDHEIVQAYCVCQTPRAYEENGILFVSWQDFVERLYEDNLFK